MRPGAVLLFAPLLSGVFAACADDVELGRDQELQSGDSGASGASGGADATGGSGASAGASECVKAVCQSRTYQCGDCIDNDADGLTDSDDPDCLGACDNTEDSYYGGIPGQNNSPCRQDCYFDQDTGPGNDSCFWNHQCDPLSTPSEYPPSGDPRCRYDANAMTPGTDESCTSLAGAQLDACLASCGPLTPNGCDCFGCCELPANSGSFVWLGSTDGGVGSCDFDRVNDPTKCRPCTPVIGCLNDCEPCEICVGKDGIDPSCAGADAPPQQCSPGIKPCGGTNGACPGGQYCITGCCRDVPA